MKEIALKAKRRETGKHAAKNIRRDGFVPGIYYVKGSDPIALVVEPIALRPIVHTALTKIISLEVEGEANPLNCVLKAVKFHPITDKVMHFDLLGITKGQKLTVEVPFKLIGQPIGVRQGGVLQHTCHKTKITCLPKDLIEAIEVDIAGLELGKSVHVRDLNYPDVEINIPEETLIVSVIAPRVAVAATPGK